jgi:hypothetical protein
VIHITLTGRYRRSLGCVTLVRLISPAARSLLLMLVGFGLLAVPFALGLGEAALVTGVLVGAVCVSLALAGTDTEGRGTIPLAAHAVYDRAIGVGLIVSAAIFAIAGEPGAAMVFGALGLIALLVTSITSYSARTA